MEENGTDEIIINPFETKAKNICEKFDLDYKQLKLQYNLNANDNIYTMKIEDDNNDILEFQFKAYELWFDAFIYLSSVLRNIELSE